MSKTTEAFGWRMLNLAHRWPIRVRWLEGVFNDLGNYGIRGTIRERVVRGVFYLGLRNLLLYTLGLRQFYGWLLYWIYSKRGWRFYPWELRYAAQARCCCGAGLAYPTQGYHLPSKAPGMFVACWVCSARLRGDQGTNHEYFPWAFYDVESENQVHSGSGRNKPVLWGLLGYRYPTKREVGITTRPSP